MNQTQTLYTSMPQASMPQVDFSTGGMSGYFSSSPSSIAITPVGAPSPNKNVIDLGGGGSDWTPGGTTPSGNHGGEAYPIGDVCWPLLLCCMLYMIIKRRVRCKYSN